MPAMKMPGGSSAKPTPKPVPAQAKKADAADTKKTTSLNKPKPAPAPAPAPAPVPKPAPAPTPTKIATSTSSTNNTTTSNTSNTVTSQQPSTTNPPMSATPAPTTPTVVEPVVVRTPTRNVTEISSLVPQYDAQQIQRVLFENLSAIELSKVERHDTIEGIDQKYSIISNLSEIRKKYDIIKQLTVMDKLKPLTSIFTINIQDKIPQEDYITLESLDSTYQYLDENNQVVTREKGYYYIDTNGDLVIELINLERNQQVEVLVDTNGTIYKVES